MKTALFKGQRMDGKGGAIGCHVFSLEDGNLIVETKHSSGNQEEPPCDYQECHRINPETLCQFTGLTAEWFNQGVDPRIWSGDLFEVDTLSGVAQFKVKVVYKGAAFFAVRIGDTRDEQLLFKFLSDRVYTKIGNIHEAN